MSKFDSKPEDWKFENEQTNQQEPQHSTSPNPFSQIQLIFSFIKDYKSKRYTGISPISIGLIIVGLIYLISPIDLIPDFSFPFIGFVNDAAVLAFVASRWKKELYKYKLWKQKN